jgi:hypothetical protein
MSASSQDLAVPLALLACVLLTAGCLETATGGARCRDNSDCRPSNRCEEGRCKPRPGRRAECGGSVPTTSESCERCFITHCCEAGAECRASPACSALDDCMVNCEADRDCAEQCRRERPCGLQAWHSLLACEYHACRDVCGVRDPGTYPGQGRSCAEGACELAAQCGCGPGQACHVGELTTGRTACFPAGTGTRDQLCAKNEDCSVGSGCLEGLCKAYCAQATGCGSGDCATATTGLPGCPPIPVTTWKYCTTPCQPDRSEQACPAGTACGAYLAQSDCHRTTGDNRTVNGCSRTDPYACAPNHLCATHLGQTTGDCKRWCRVGSTTTCGPGRCGPLAYPVVLDGEEYGVCYDACDPVDPATACGAGATCEAAQGGWTNCVGTTGTGTGTGDCSATSPYACRPGYTCIGYGNGTAACRQWCVVGAGGCMGGYRCTGFPQPLELGGLTYGFCEPG